MCNSGSRAANVVNKGKGRGACVPQWLVGKGRAWWVHV
jgi:hypothetical protein